MKIAGWNISRSKRANGLGAQAAPQQTTAAGAWLGPVNTTARTQRSNLANEFAAVNAIVDEVYSREFFPTKSDGTRDTDANSSLLRVLARPNSNMNERMLVSTLISGTLTLPEMNVLLWHLENRDGEIVQTPGAPAGGFTEQTISGMTILPRGTRITGPDYEPRYVFNFNGARHVVERNSVLSLKSAILPDDGVSGISPGSATQTEAGIMDRLVQQQRAYFDNGAKPDVMVKIHARTAQEAENFKALYLRNLRGARAAGGTLFSTILSGEDGAPAAWMEVEPVNATNHAQDVPAIAEFAQGRIDGAQGVSPLMYGRADAATYNNQQTAKARFYEKVDNLLMRFFDNFQHELERVVGAELSFNFGWTTREIEITDEKKTQADTRVANVNAFLALVNAGASAGQAAEALGLNDFANLSVKPAENTAPTNITANITPPAKTETNNYFTTLEKNAKDEQQHLENSAKTRVADRQKHEISVLHEHLLDFAKNRVQKAAKRTNALDPSDQMRVSQIVADLLQIAENGGTTAARQIAQQLKTRVVDTGYEISPNALNLILARANNVLANFAEFLDGKAADAEAAGATDAKAIGQYVFERDDGGKTAVLARIRAIEVGESKFAFQTAQVDSGAQIQDGTPGMTIAKIWHTTSAEPCKFCATMDGVEAGVKDVFPNTAAKIADPQGDFMSPKYTDGTTPDAHAQCQCVFSWKVAESDPENADFAQYTSAGGAA